MTHPWIFEANFETGDNSQWDSEADAAGQLDFPHYTELARLPFRYALPFSGAYCMRATLSGGTADAFVKEGDIDASAGVNRFVKFDLLFGDDFTASADDTFALFEALASATVEVSMGAKITASSDAIQLGIGETAPTSFGNPEIERGKWYTVEIDLTIDAGGGNDGTVDLFVTKVDDDASTTVFTTQVSGLDQGAITDGQLGIQDHLATTTGTILFDNFIYDDGRVYPTPRFPRNRNLTQSGHAFVGPGTLDSALLLSTNNDNQMKLYDTDEGNTNLGQGYVVDLDMSGNVISASGPITFEKGCYVELSGTDPRGQVTVTTQSDRAGLLGPSFDSDALIKHYALGR